MVTASQKALTKRGLKKPKLDKSKFLDAVKKTKSKDNKIKLKGYRELNELFKKS